MVRKFLSICNYLGVPVAVDKTEWASRRVVFLGILMDGEHLVLSLPIDKRDKAINMLLYFVNRRKATVKHIQTLTGYLNFLGKAIFPGRAFTRRMYSKFSFLDKKHSHKSVLKLYHHVATDKEFKLDCQVWLKFLSESMKKVVCRPMIDLELTLSATILNFYTDASANHRLG